MQVENVCDRNLNRLVFFLFQRRAFFYRR
jgi:hypothetical protein